MTIEKKKILDALEADLLNVSNIQDLQNIKARYLGKKGTVTDLMKEIGRIPPESKKEYGMLVNELKNDIEALLETKEEQVRELEKKSLETKNWVDVSLPGARRAVGSEHLVMKAIREISEVFINMGCTIVEGPEIEIPWYNFDALNIAPWHPARDMQDTFYIESEKNLILRTHTSPVQVRTMLKSKPPLAIISPGRVYRKDEIDATHAAMFNQVEGLYIDRQVSVAHLKMFLEILAKSMFGDRMQVLLRPSYFAFVEPGFEVDVSCMNCGGKGCNVCKNTGWIEILGAGLVHPNVLRNSGIDPNEWQGFAFGMGAERIALLKYGVNNLREFTRNDIRVIE